VEDIHLLLIQARGKKNQTSIGNTSKINWVYWIIFFESKVGGFALVAYAYL